MSEEIRHITSRPNSFELGLQEVWSKRELLAWLGWRDLTVRYRQTVIGILWAVIQPVAMMLLFTATFGILVRVPSDNLPYSVLVLSGLVPWALLSSVVSAAASSLVSNASLISKVYFARIILVLSYAIAPFVDYLIALLILLALLAWFGITPSMNVVLLPGFGLLIALTALGPGLWFATLNVRFRDVRFVVPFLLQLGMFTTPVVYPISLVPEKYLNFYSLNPGVFLVEGFRYLLFGSATVTAVAAISWLTFALVAFLSGAMYLRAEEKSFADQI